MVKSPCVGRGICSTALGDKVCKGCGRYDYEVDNWNQLSDPVKKGIIKRIKGNHDRNK